MTQPTAPHDASAPPDPGHRRAALITAALLALWLGLTLGADRVAPALAAATDAFEVRFGLDLSNGQVEE
jgi:hypothetical protein